MTSHWDRVRVYGTWLGQDGALKAGKYVVNIPVRVTSATDDVIIPAGKFSGGDLQTTVSASPSLDIMVPATDDPDINEGGWQVKLDITFNDGGKESYSLIVPIADRPLASGGTGLGIDLSTIAFPQTVPQTVLLYKVGVPGGLARLNDDGDVVNSDGNVVTGGGGGGSIVATDITDSTTIGRAILKSVDAPAVLAAISGASSARQINGHALTSDVTVTKSDVGLGSVDNTADAAKAVLSATKLTTARTIAGKSFDGTAAITIAASDVGAVPTTRTVNGHALSADVVVSASDITTGTLPASVLPAIAISEYAGDAANQTAMLALTGQKGDWTVRADTGAVWIIIGTDPTQLSSWKQLSYPTAPVTSVAGKTGVVTLAKADVSLGSVDNTADAAKAVLSATKLATARTIAGQSFDGTANISIAKGDVGLGNVDNTADSAKPVSTAQQTALNKKMEVCFEVTGTYTRPATTAPVMFVGADTPPTGGTTAGGAGTVDGLDLYAAIP